MYYSLTNLYTGETKTVAGDPYSVEQQLRAMFPDALYFVPAGDITQCLQLVARMQAVMLTGDPIPQVEGDGDGYNYDAEGSFPKGDGWPREGDRSPYLQAQLANKKDSKK